MESLSVKWRPKSWAEIVGQNIVVSILCRQLTTSTWKNAYLFCGPHGCGKTTAARLFARDINNGEGFPIEIDAASNSGIDNVRNIISDAQQGSVISDYKVFIFDEAHQLSKAAWDAMLKIIEEPPTNVIFIFCTTNPAKIPDTILSRVQRFDFNKVPNKLIADRLEFIVQEDLHIPYTREALEAIAIAAKGHVRDAIQLLDKCVSVVDNLNTDNVSNIVGFVDYTELANIENAVIVKDLNSCMKAYEKIKLHSSLNCNIYNSITEFAVNAALYAITKDKAIVDIPDNICYNLNNNFEIANLFVDRLINFAPYITEENADIFLKTIFMEMCK